MRALALPLFVAVACAAPPAESGVPTRDTVGAPDGSQPATPLDGPDSAQPTTLLDRHDFARPTDSLELPDRLAEISGLAFSTAGDLFAHADERGRVHRIDVEARDVGKRFDLGEDGVPGDFEGIAIAGERFFLVTSTAWLYEFREGADRENVAYRVTDTGIGGRCEVEGLEYDARDVALLLACKVASGSAGSIVVHRLPLDPAAPRLAPVTIRKAQLREHGLDADFDPSGIAVDPTGTLVLISARQEAIVEVTRDGRVVAAAKLPAGRHPQPEGVAFAPDGTLYIADERNGRPARLTAYERRLPDAPG